MIGLYLHIPFCAKKCHYCDFVISPSGTAEKHADFIECLKKEAAERTARFKKIEFDTLYLGGGTPSALRNDEIEKVFEILYKNFKFKKDAEITCETNPGDIDASKANLFQKLGINRISLGAQTFNDETLKRLNRAHDAWAIGESYQILRNAGFQNISLDLILSLPGETLADVQTSLELTKDLDPEHVSLYELTIEEKTVFGREFKNGSLILPSEEDQMEMLKTARAFLIDNGYEHYELLSYAKLGFESRHNKLYWANGEYLGLGPGAYSNYGGSRFRLANSYDQYLQKVKTGDWKPNDEETLTGEKKENESLVLALRLTEGVEIETFQPVIKRLSANIQDLENKGLVEKTSKHLRLTPRGHFFAETVFSELT
jgi:oxygen-independent coproporphyrinogen III oxidase